MQPRDNVQHNYVMLLQVIAYLAGLHASGMWRPTLVVAPATVLRQWMTELRTWSVRMCQMSVKT